MTMICGGSFSTLEISHVALKTLVGTAHKDVGGIEAGCDKKSRIFC